MKRAPGSITLRQFAVGAVFPVMAARSGAVPFFFFALMMVAQFVVVLTLYPETSGISLEEMEHRI